MGHVVQYAVLAMLLWPVCRGRWLPILGIAVVYAALDEWHQSFVPSRQGSVVDVMIDTAGAVLALVFLSGIVRFRARRALQHA